MKKYMRYLGPALVACIFSLAVYLLYRKLSSYSIAEIRASMEQIPHVRIALALLLAFVNYLILMGYDWLALKAIGKNLPISRVALVSVIGQAVSFNFGALLGGTSVRYRFYSVWGFELHEVLHLILMLGVAFWVGALGLSGLVFIVAPPSLPDELLEALPLHDVRLLGYVLAGVALCYMVLCFRMRGPIRVFGRTFVFPPPRIAVAQLLVSWLDLIGAAACMWVLLPSAVGVSFIDFLPGYLMAMVAVVLTHIPGGVGIFELVILHLTKTHHDEMVFAAVLVFRIIYYILPLIAAAVLLAGYEVRQRKNLLQDAGRWLSVVSPIIASYLVFLAGTALLVSSTLPSALTRLTWLGAWLPACVISGGHLICAVSGCLLLFLSHGVGQRRRPAFRLAVLFLTTGIAGALLKGFSWPAALMAAAVLVPLCLAHFRFYRTSWRDGDAIPLRWLSMALFVVAANFALGWVLYRTAWGVAAVLATDGPANAARALHANIAIAALLPCLFAARAWLRGRPSSGGAGPEEEGPEEGGPEGRGPGDGGSGDQAGS